MLALIFSAFLNFSASHSRLIEVMPRTRRLIPSTALQAPQPCDPVLLLESSIQHLHQHNPKRLPTSHARLPTSDRLLWRSISYVHVPKCGALPNGPPRNGKYTQAAP